MFAHFTLPVVIFLSAFGALVMCVLLLRSGILSARPSAATEHSADFAGGRFGPAFAATCFVILAVLAVIGLVQQVRAARLARATQQDVVPKIAELREHLIGLNARLVDAESRLGARAESAEAVAGRVGERVSGLDRRIVEAQAAIRQLSGEVARVQASMRQAERNAVAEATRVGMSRRSAASVEPTTRAVPRVPASLSSSPSASPPTAVPPPRPDVRVTPETMSPAMPPAPTIALPTSATPSPRPSPEGREDRVAPQSTPSAKQDLRTQMHNDWEAMKHDARATGNEIKDAFRKFRDWIRP